MSEDMSVDKHTTDDKNIALCYYYRNPPDGSKPTAYDEICKKVRLRYGAKPTEHSREMHTTQTTPGPSSGAMVG